MENVKENEKLKIHDIFHYMSDSKSISMRNCIQSNDNKKTRTYINDFLNRARKPQTLPLFALLSILFASEINQQHQNYNLI